MLQPKLSVTLL